MSKDYDEWSHLWLGNPVYRELGPDWSIGWVLEDHEHRVVGTMGNIPLSYEFEGKRILAASGRHWVAEPAYRSVSLLLLDRVVNQRNVDLYLNNTVTAESTAALSVETYARSASGPSSATRTAREPTTTPSASSATARAWSGVEIPKPA